MNVEKMEEKGLQSPLIIRDENGNKCVCNTTVSTSLNGSTVDQYQELEHEDYLALKDTNEMINTSSHAQSTKAQDLQKAVSDYICMGALDLEAVHVHSAKEQSCMHALNQNFLEPVSFLKDGLAVKSIQNRSTEESVPYHQADLMHPLHLATVGLNTEIEDELGSTEMGQEGASSNESFITVINLWDTAGTECYEKGCVHQAFISSEKMYARDSCTSHAGSLKLDASGNPNMTNVNLDRRVQPTVLSPRGGEITNYIDLVSQNSEYHRKQDAEYSDPHFSGSPEPFHLYKGDHKKYMHSTPEHGEGKWPAKSRGDGVIDSVCPLPIQSFDEHSKQEFHRDSETLAKVPTVSKGDGVFLDEQAEVSETIQNGIPNLERAVLPESICQATFVVFSPTAGDRTTSQTAGSKNATFTVLAMPDEASGEISKAGKNGRLVKDPPRRNSFRSHLEHIAIKPTNRSPFAATITKARKAEIVSFPKPNFKNVKPKVMSRPVLQPKESTALKAAQRSPQLSTTSSSSPSSSPRQTSSSGIMLRKKMDLDKGTKAEMPMNKAHKQYFNKHFPSQVVHAVTHSENTSHKVPKTTVLKQNVEQVDRRRCPSSACSSVSTVVAAACSLNSGGTLNDKMEIANSEVQPSALNTCRIPSEEQHNDCLGIPATEGSVQDSTNEVFGLVHLPLSPLPKAETSQSSAKNSPVFPRNLSATRITFRSRRGSEGKNVHTPKASPLQRTVQPLNSGTEHFSPKGRLTSVKVAPGSWTSSGKSIPKSKVPIKGPGFRRTSSISSISSTQSDQSTYSNNSTSATIIIKNGVWPSKSACQNGSAGSITIKPVPRPRVHSLKNTPKGVKSKLGSVSQCMPKSCGSLSGRKTGDPRGSQRFGPSGQNGPPSLLSTFNSVDKGKQKGPKNSCIQTQTSTEVLSAETKTHELTQYKRKCENQRGIIQQLKKCLASGNRRFEALALVIQHLQFQKEETLKQRKELSLELLDLRGELVTTSAACEKLEKDRNELQVAYEGFVQKLNQQHQNDLAELEERLKQFYTAECEKLQSICIEEAEKYKAQLQEQVDNLNITHENFKLELETSHTEKVDELKKEYESSFSEIKNAHELERRTLEESFQKKHEELEKKIGELQSENESLNEKLKLEEQKRIAKEKANHKNPQFMYLEQELESLKAVLEIKNEKLHQQDIKLLKTEKLVENNTALVEKLRKLQQENEELKARMDKHMELSRQLSTEQAVLQESLEKESKVNKRLSMENEELLWKLHNGDLCSPRKLSPSTPPMPFQSPRNSSSFSSPSVSPR